MIQLPTGTVTFLFTDIEGSTKLWQQFPLEMPVALSQHHSLLNEAITVHGGYVFQIIGDAFCAAFLTAADGLEAALAAQRALHNEPWGATGMILVRMALHTGAVQVRTGEYKSGEYVSGLTLSRAARLLSAGHGGQILLSMPTYELVRDQLPIGVTLRDMGLQRLKDLIRPEHIFQVVASGLPANFPALKTLDSLPNNLPMQMTSFVGREKEVSDIKEIMKQARLATLIGVGGSGKTRLALHAAADLVDSFTDGVWFVDLAPLSNPLFVLQAIADALNLREVGGRALVELLADYLRRRELLLVLDNCEHLIESCARAVDQILHVAPQVKIIATGREALGVEGEHVYLVPPLSTPDSHQLYPLETLSQYEAVRLFIDRALAARNDFAVTNTNAPAVAQICYMLDGIPLAIELAAARVNAMPPEMISARLDDRFRLLTGSSRTAIPRHQTLRAAVDWSWELLSVNERILLRRLSVFAGGWSLEAAEAVCAGEGLEEIEILDLVTHLVSKSLVTWQEHEGESRYHLLEILRQYASEKLAEAGEEAYLRRRHTDFYTYWMEAAAQRMHSPLYLAWIKHIEAEQDNLHAALEWGVKYQPGTALRIANALAESYWSLCSAYAETVHWYEQALPSALEVPLEVHAYALAYEAEFSLQLGQIMANEIEEALRLARQSGNNTLLATVLIILGEIRLESGDPDGAMTCFEDALHLTDSPLVQSWVLGNLGYMCIATRDYGQAESYFQRSVNLARSAYNQGQLIGRLWDLGYLALLRGDIAKARSDLIEGLHMAREVQRRTSIAHISETLGIVYIYDKAYDDARTLISQALSMLQELGMRSCLAHNLDAWARLTLAQGDPRRAARLLGALKAHLGRLGMSMIPLQQALIDQTHAAVQQQLDPQTFQSELSAGEKLDIEKAIALLAVGP